jgi:NAD(P)-dependent dehydrogenase (short-subunit alcohol dehydrogenase family)
VGRFDGRVAVVTGAGGGIGRATAERFATEGASVVCADIDGTSAERTAGAIEANGGSAWGTACDVTDPASGSGVIAAARERYGAVHILANVAGVGCFKPTPTLTLDEWNRTLAVNLTGTFLMCQHALDELLASRGTIVNMASVAGLRATPYNAAYCASKGGVVMLTKSLAIEFGRQGVRVNCVCPSAVDTPFLEASNGRPTATPRCSPVPARSSNAACTPPRSPPWWRSWRRTRRRWSPGPPTSSTAARWRSGGLAQRWPGAAVAWRRAADVQRAKPVRLTRSACGGRRRRRPNGPSRRARCATCCRSST